jgi:hypothetical protein
MEGGEGLCKLLVSPKVKGGLHRPPLTLDHQKRSGLDDAYEEFADAAISVAGHRTPRQTFTGLPAGSGGGVGNWSIK